MSLPGTIVRRPNDFSQPDFDVIYKDPDGRELIVGRIMKNHGWVGGVRPWFRGVEFHQAQGRSLPYLWASGVDQRRRSRLAQMLGFCRRSDKLAACNADA